LGIDAIVSEGKMSLLVTMALPAPPGSSRGQSEELRQRNITFAFSIATSDPAPFRLKPVHMFRDDRERESESALRVRLEGIALTSQLKLHRASWFRVFHSTVKTAPSIEK
jgi:hypothetical protein